MTTIDNEFIFHNVGHGLFYSGKIDNFNFVYDCGSKKMPINAIQSYKKSLTEKNNYKLDLLIISHFHEDHMNGLVELLKGIEVDTVIIPYYEPIKRAITAVEIIEENNKEWLFEFIADPISYLLDKEGVEWKINKIMIILPKNYRKKLKSREAEREEFSNETHNEINADDNLIPDSKEIKDFGDYDGLDSAKKKYGNKLKVYPFNFSMKWLDKWQFRFFCHDYGQKRQLKKLKKDIEKELDNKDLIAIIKDEKSRKEMRRIYGNFTKGIPNKKSSLNPTSLVMCHEPINHCYIIKTKRHCHKCNKFIPYYLKLKYNSHLNIFESIKNDKCKEAILSISPQNNDYPCGQLLLSDAELLIPNYFIDFNVYFKNYFKRFMLIQIPHHGSVNNWNDELLKRAKNCYFWVPSYKTKDKCHPSKKVLDYIKKQERLVFHCNENISIHIEFEQ